MRLFTFGLKSEDKETVGGCGRRAWRWAFVADRMYKGRKNWGLTVGFEEEVCFLDKENEWYDAVRYYTINLTEHFSLGREHIYYDGPHDSFSVGWLHICWSGDWCDRCYEGR